MTKLRKKQRHRSLTLVFALFIFSILVVSLLLTVGIVYLSAFIWRNSAPFSDLSLSDTLQILLLAAAVSLIVGTGLSALAVRIPLKPINWLIDQMNRLAAGDFQARVHFGKTIDMIPAFLQVEESFNKMAEELGNTEMLRQDFINNFSHEFKTPIVSVAGFAKLLQRADLDEEQRREYIDAIVEESRRLSNMATNVLKLTNVENQTILTGVSRYNLSEQIRSAVLLLESQWSAKHLELEMDFPEISITANEDMMQEVWINLVHNAVKYSPEYGPLQVRIRETENTIEVQVANSGEIPKEDLGRIFQKFYQADHSHFSAGNGVGLAIVKRVVELHGGTVTAESTGGAVIFTVVLPKGEKEAS